MRHDKGSNYWNGGSYTPEFGAGLDGPGQLKKWSPKMTPRFLELRGF